MVAIVKSYCFTYICIFHFISMNSETKQNSSVDLIAGNKEMAKDR